MKLRTIAIVIVLLLSWTSMVGGAVTTKKNSREFKDKDKNKDKKAEVVSSQIGLKIPEWGIAIDAIFNPELTDIIPGYHIINLVLSNSRDEQIALDPRRDKWIIIDNIGKRHAAYNHVKQFDKDLWPRLPKRLQDLLDYPHTVSPGKSTTIDVFVPKSIDLFNFREVVWKSEHFKKEFNVLTNYEKNLNIEKNTKEFDTPRSSSPVDLSPESLPPPQPQGGDTPSKYSAPPKIGEVVAPDSAQSAHPPFDPSLDDTIIIRE